VQMQYPHPSPLPGRGWSTPAPSGAILRLMSMGGQVGCPSRKPPRGERPATRSPPSAYPTRTRSRPRSREPRAATREPACPAVPNFQPRLTPYRRRLDRRLAVLHIDREARRAAVCTWRSAGRGCSQLGEESVGRNRAGGLTAPGAKGDVFLKDPLEVPASSSRERSLLGRPQ